jgi:hypothetical protein
MENPEEEKVIQAMNEEIYKFLIYDTFVDEKLAKDIIKNIQKYVRNKAREMYDDYKRDGNLQTLDNKDLYTEYIQDVFTVFNCDG